MIETVQANDGIDEPEFGYYARMEGYAILSSDMKELAAILGGSGKPVTSEYCTMVNQFHRSRLWV